MAPWANDDLILYHGCTEDSLRPKNKNGIALGSAAHSINLSVGGRRAEFGRGFYATTWMHQAQSWANRKARMASSGKAVPKAIVLRFDVRRNDLADLQALVFTNENCGFWPFVSYCRAGSRPHGRSGSSKTEYDIVYGPVSIWPQQLVIKDCDQVSFHTQNALNAIPMLTLVATGNPLF